MQGYFSALKLIKGANILFLLSLTFPSEWVSWPLWVALILWKRSWVNGVILVFCGVNTWKSVMSNQALLLPDDKGRRRGGEQPEQAELRGGWRCEGGGDFSSRMPGDDCNQFALYAIGWRLDLFSETYTFNCSREERESDQVNLADRGTIFGGFSCIQRHHFHFYLLLVLSFIMGCLQYLMRGRLTWKCLYNKYSLYKQPLWAVKTYSSTTFLLGSVLPNMLHQTEVENWTLKMSKHCTLNLLFMPSAAHQACFFLVESNQRLNLTQKC